MRISYHLSRQLQVGSLIFASFLLSLSPFHWSLEPQALAQQEPPSFLNPANPQSNKTYQFPLTIVNPTAQSNPAGSGAPGFRGENQLILYTSEFGTHTGTNEAGFEVVIENGVITQTHAGNSEIPAGGLVISGHGSAAQWLTRFGKMGSLASWDQASQQLTIQFTPNTYLFEVDTALKQAMERPATAGDYQTHLQAAQACRAQLASLQNTPVNTEMATLAEDCLHKANIAFYNSIPNNPQAFRGTWIRPESTSREDIRKTIETLKKNRIENIFLETYYQGKTIYPSAVMATYGLPEQHPRYKNADPLKLWIEEAHQQGLKVHVWSQIFFAGNQKENIEQYGPILHKYPQWRNIQRPHWNNPNPVISDVEPGHYFLDPANPEVRTFLNKLLMEMVTQYDLDGLNLDYIRYPASAAVTKPYFLGTTWGYTESARKQFKALIEAERTEAETKRVEALKKAGKPALISAATITTPSADPKDLTPNNPLWSRWVEWRKEQVSSFVKQISTDARTAKPNLLMSAVVFPSHDPTYALKLQDYPRWVKEGNIQALTPIGLSTNLDKMREQCKTLKVQVQDKIPVYVGIFSLYNRTGPIELVKEIDVTNQQGMGGVVLFDGARLTPAYSEALLEGPFRP
jgi:uncharacterized lipoprotein YddW (UPF0748 family)